MSGSPSAIQHAYQAYEQENYTQAERLCRKILTQQPFHLEALRLFANCYQHKAQQGKKAPSDFETLMWLGNYAFNQGQDEAAAQYFEQALAINPNHDETARNLSVTYYRLRRDEESFHWNQHAFELSPSPEVCFEQALALPYLYTSSDHVIQARQQFTRNLHALSREGITIGNRLTRWPSFFLAYQGLNDRDLQMTIARLFKPPVGSQTLKPHAAHEKPRIGFISRNFTRRHTIGKLTQGLIEHLSDERFDRYLFYVDPHYGNHNNPNALYGNGMTHIRVPAKDLPLAQAIIAKQELDILVYTDIGMDFSTYRLAQKRLAPVQCVMWGHPVTTGIETMDYFITSSLIEPAEATSHYSENLLLMDTLPTYYYKPTLDLAPPLTKEDFGFAATDHLYLCPQSLMKFHPDFDLILQAILAQDPLGKVVLIEDRAPHANVFLMARFQQAMPNEVSRVIMLKRQPWAHFINLMAIADVILDPLYFGGGNTAYEALAFGTPIVTLPGELMRGRITLGCYDKMGIPDLIAQDSGHYVDLACQLGQDPAFRQAMKEKILATHHVLYEDQQAVLEFEDALLMILDMAKSPA